MFHILFIRIIFYQELLYSLINNRYWMTHLDAFSTFIRYSVSSLNSACRLSPKVDGTYKEKCVLQEEWTCGYYYTVFILYAFMLYPPG